MTLHKIDSVVLIPPENLAATIAVIIISLSLTLLLVSSGCFIPIKISSVNPKIDMILSGVSIGFIFIGSKNKITEPTANPLFY